MTVFLARKVRTLVMAIAAVVAVLGLAVVGSGAANATGVYTEIFYAPGQNSGTVDGTIVSGTTDTWLLDARAGQRLTTDLSSIDGNARFTITGPDGRRICIDQTWSQIWLPLNGKYAVTISSVRGYATYWLTTSIN